MYHPGASALAVSSKVPVSRLWLSYRTGSQWLMSRLSRLNFTGLAVNVLTVGLLSV